MTSRDEKDEKAASNSGEETKKLVTRREFLGVSGAAAAGAVIAAAIAGGAIGYFAGQASASPLAKPSYKTVTKTATKTVSAAARKLLAGYIYVGPIGDYGWTHAHDEGRKWADSHVPGWKSIYIESVPETEATGAIENLISQGAKLVITTSFGYMDATADEAAKHPDTYFVHISGYRSGAAGNAPQNMSSAFAEFYQLYYLCGLAAGAMTKTGVMGYVAAYPTPEVVRHINAFTLGANYAYKKRTGKNIETYVVWLFNWFNPGKARQAAVSLVESRNADALAFTEDSPTTLQVAEEYTEKGRRVWSFSHYSDMRRYGPHAHLTGQLVNWGPIYREFYRMVETNSWVSVDIWSRIGDFVPYRWMRPLDKTTCCKPEGTVYLAPLNPVVPGEWATRIKQRYEEMKELIFEPFSPEGNLGEPIRDQDGNVRIDGKKVPRANHDMLWSMNWFVEYVKSKIPK